MHILPEGADPYKCLLAGTIIWILGFTSVLCWSILQVPDGGGSAAWVPDAFCREALLIPLRPLIFALPSFFWPLTLVFLTAKGAETYCGVPLARRRARRRRRGRGTSSSSSSSRAGAAWGRRPGGRESHDEEEAYSLLLRDGDGDGHHDDDYDDDDDDDDYSFDDEDGIPLSDLSDLSDDSPRPSCETSPPSPPTAMMEVPAALGTAPGAFRFVAYQPTPPATLRAS